MKESETEAENSGWIGCAITRERKKQVKSKLRSRGDYQELVLDTKLEVSVRHLSASRNPWFEHNG